MTFEVKVEGGTRTVRNADLTADQSASSEFLERVAREAEALWPGCKVAAFLFRRTEGDARGLWAVHYYGNHVAEVLHPMVHGAMEAHAEILARQRALEGEPQGEA